jgi:hypothetical protein
MAPTVVSVDVNRPQAEAFAYVTDPPHFAEWQNGVVGGSMDGESTSARSARPPAG